MDSSNLQTEINNKTTEIINIIGGLIDLIFEENKCITKRIVELEKKLNLKG